MIVFKNDCNEPPFVKFREIYNIADQNNQLLIHAASISSFSSEKNEVNSRFVNIKFLDNDKFIFFTNYESPKSDEFFEHHQIAALFFWTSINIQVRIKAKISKTSKKFNNDYFSSRSFDKNALSISSQQSKKIDSYSEVKSNFERAMNTKDLKKCPKYWGGFEFKPYYFEFWEGNDSRINRRESFEKKDNSWIISTLQP